MNLKRTLNSAPVAMLAASAAVALLAGVGCKSTETSETPAKPQSPATGPTMQAPAPVTPTTAPATAPVVAAPAMKEADYTHTLAVDSPAYESMPMGDSKPAMVASSGMKCLVITPGLKYSKILSVSGKTMYVPTAALKPIGK